MATVSNVVLSVGRATAQTEFAEVDYDVEFSAAEIALNLRFREAVVLHERDETRDVYSWFAFANLSESGSSPLVQYKAENWDENIGLIYDDDSLVATQGVVHRSHRREWNFGNQERNNEEYVAAVVVVPEISVGGGQSNEVSINLG